MKNNLLNRTKVIELIKQSLPAMDQQYTNDASDYLCMSKHYLNDKYMMSVSVWEFEAGNTELEFVVFDVLREKHLLTHKIMRSEKVLVNYTLANMLHIGTEVNKLIEFYECNLKLNK